MSSLEDRFKVVTPFTESRMNRKEVIQRFRLSSEAKRVLSKLKVGSSITVGKTTLTLVECSDGK